MMARGPLTCAAALAVSIALAGCGSDDTLAGQPAKATAAAAKSELPPGRIAFRRWLDDARTHGAIFTIGTDGTAEKQVTRPEAGWADDMPDWSPDGRLIAYQHCSEGQPCSVWVVDAGGGNAHRVDFHCRLPGCDVAGPGWTPDGRLVATVEQGAVRTFGGAPQIQESAIATMDLESGKQRTIYRRTGWAGGANDPQVSPDGRTVIYTRWNSARSKPSFGKGLFAVGIDGSGNRQLAPWQLGGGDHAVFSPSGSILFRSFEDDDAKQSDFWTVRPDGSRLKQLTHFDEGTLVLSASYSPDGKWIVHASDGAGGNADLYVMRADGTGNQPLTHTEAWDSAPDWKPR